MKQDARSILYSFVSDLTKLSKCHDRKVACVICDKDFQQIYSIGINGGPKGTTEEWECLCDADTKYSCIHAEANALIKLTTRVPNKIMVCSLAPCLQCASMIINEPGGFYGILFIEPYKDVSAIKLLNSAGIVTGRLNPDGSISRN